MERPEPGPANALPRFALLYAALYAAYGTESAYMPAFLQSHGLALEQIGLVLAAGTMARIVAGPVAGRMADSLNAHRPVLGVAAGLSGLVGLSYTFAFGIGPLLAVSVGHAVATASLAPLSDALSVATSSNGQRFQYGWVRGIGSAAFVAGTLLSGLLIERLGLGSIILSSSLLFLVTAAATVGIPSSGLKDPVRQSGLHALKTLWGFKTYRRLIAVAVLVIGSHAMSDTFAVIQWRTAGYGGLAISFLWCGSVFAELVVFLLVGTWLVQRLGVRGAALLSAAAGVVRWSILAVTTSLPALICVQALHGLTFALMHLVAMRIIGALPGHLAGTAQGLYGTGALGIASAATTVLSGYLYGWLETGAYAAMALMCALALVFANGLKSDG